MGRLDCHTSRAPESRPCPVAESGSTLVSPAGEFQIRPRLHHDHQADGGSFRKGVIARLAKKHGRPPSTG